MFGALAFFLFLPLGALADHEEPERIVEGKHSVVLSLVPEGKAMRLKFFFRDVLSGRSPAGPISLDLKITDEKNILTMFEEKNIKAKNGVGEFTYQFPSDGLYNVFMEFEKADEPGHIYRPAPWLIWVPGLETGGGRSYPIGVSELAGFGLVALLALIILINFWRRRRSVV